MPSERSTSRRSVTTPMRTSEFVRTKSPSFSEIFGRPAGLSFSLRRSSTVPRTPPAKTTFRAVNVRVFLRNGNGERPVRAVIA